MGEWSLEGIPAGYFVNRVVIVTLVTSLAVFVYFLWIFACVLIT